MVHSKNQMLLGPPYYWKEEGGLKLLGKAPKVLPRSRELKGLYTPVELYPLIMIESQNRAATNRVSYCLPLNLR